MASLTGKLVADTYRALLKTIDNDILIASEKQITDGMGGGSGVFIDSQGFLRANKYIVTNGTASQFLKGNGTLDGNTYLTGITSAQVIMALGYTPVPSTRLLTINGITRDLSQNRTWTIESGGTWGSITGTLSDQLDLQAALDGKFNNPTGTIEQYIRGDGTLATYTGSSGQTKNEVKLGATLAKGTPVYVSSANGTNMIVSASSNTTEATSSKTFGLLETGGVLNDLVQCVTYGLVSGLDTSAATAGDPVWLGVNGALLFGLANKPYAPAHMVYIGVVTRVQSNNGEIFVNVQNGFELDELHNVAARTPSNNEGLFYETSTSLWKNKSIATVLGYVPQPQLNGTGFVKASGTTISYDNSSYQPLDSDLTAIAGLSSSSGLLRKIDSATWEIDQAEYMTISAGDARYESLSNKKNSLVANSTTFYYSVTAVNNALADKMNINGGTFTGSLTIASSAPSLILNDTSSGGVFRWVSDGGQLFLQNGTSILTTLMTINSSGAITNASSIAATSFIKSGGSSGQFLKADGSVDSSSYQPLDADLTAIAGLALTTGLLRKNGMNTWELDQNQYITTADLSGYQTVANLSTNLTASATKYPNVNAVNTGLGLRLALAGGTMTGELILGYSTPTLTFNDTSSGNVYKFINDAGTFKLNYLSTNIVSIGTGGAITAGSFIKSGGTSSQYLMADGSVTTGGAGVTGSGTTNYLSKWSSSSALNNSAIYQNGSNIGIGTTSPAADLHIIRYAGSQRAMMIEGNDNIVGMPTIQFKNNNGGATSYVGMATAAGGLNFNGGMYLLPSGNVGIGTSTDSGYKLDVNGTIRANGPSMFTSSQNATTIFTFQNTDTTDPSSRAYLYIISGTSYLRLKTLHGDHSYIEASSNLYFQISSSVKMLIASGGNVLIGTTTDSGYKLDVNGTARFSSSINANSDIIMANPSSNNRFYINRAAGVYTSGIFFQTGGTGDFFVGQNPLGSGSSDYTIYSYGTGSIVLNIARSTGAITFSSSVTASSFFESSDMRLKTLIDESAQIAGIEKLEAKLYKKDGKIEFGYFAQDAEKLMPYAVTKNADGFLSLSYREVHTAKIAQLEKRVAELEKQLNAA